MSKALAGVGQAAAVVGQAGLQAQLFAKRDEVLARYENERQGRDIASREKIAGHELTARSQAAAAQATATTGAARIEQQTEYTKQKREHRFKRTEPIKGEDGLFYQFVLNDAGEPVIENGKPKVEKLGERNKEYMPVADLGVTLEKTTGKTAPIEGVPSGFMTKPQRDTEKALGEKKDRFKSAASAIFQTGFMEKLGETEREELAQMIEKGWGKISTGMSEEDALGQTRKELKAWKASLDTKSKTISPGEDGLKLLNEMFPVGR